MKNALLLANFLNVHNLVQMLIISAYVVIETLALEFLRISNNL